MMNILLLSMPDTADVIDSVSRLPNLACASLAGNLPGHRVRVLDLVSVKPRIRAPIEKAIQEEHPDLIGLTAMTFQFNTLTRIARHIRSRFPGIPMVAGGYHATLFAREIGDSSPDIPLDFMVRGEGETTFRELVDAMAGTHPDWSHIAGLSYRDGNIWIHNPDRALQDLASLAIPDRSTRLISNFHYLGQPMDVAETSRGCPYDCKFCSITQMYGRTFRRFPVQRVIDDLQAIRRSGARCVFLTDDNLTHDPEHFRAVCDAIVSAGLNDLSYAVQASAVGLAGHPDLVAAMAKANFKTVFVGFESMLPAELKGMKKPTTPAVNLNAATLLRQHNIAIIAGLIVGYPDDTRETIRQSFRLARQLRPDMIYVQYLTPYPKTRIREEMLAENLVANVDDFSSYDGFSCNVRTRHLTREELHRLMKREAIRFTWRWSFLRDNRLLRWFPLALAASAIRVLGSDLWNILTARRRAIPFDL